MFEMLSTATTAAAAGAISRALTELFKIWRNDRRTLDSIRTELKHSKIAGQSGSNVLAVRILEEVQASKHKELNALTESEVREVARKLTRILEQKAAAEPHYDKSAGTAILDELRKEYASLNTHA